MHIVETKGIAYIKSVINGDVKINKANNGAYIIDVDGNAYIGKTTDAHFDEITKDAYVEEADSVYFGEVDGNATVSKVDYLKNTRRTAIGGSLIVSGKVNNLVLETPNTIYGVKEIILEEGADMDKTMVDAHDALDFLSYK